MKQQPLTLSEIKELQISRDESEDAQLKAEFAKERARQLHFRFIDRLEAIGRKYNLAGCKLTDDGRHIQGTDTIEHPEARMPVESD